MKRIGGRGRAGLVASWLAWACVPGDDAATGATAGSSTTEATTSASGATGASTTSSASATTSSASATTSATGDATTSTTTAAETGTTDPSTTTGATSTTSDATTSTTEEPTTTGADGIVALKIDPPAAKIVVSSGWSAPLALSVVGVDGRGVEVAVDAAWSVDDPALAEVTLFGGAVQATNTAAGVVMVTASADGIEAAAPVTIELLDELPTCPPRPPLTEGAPAPGAFVKAVAPEYEGTSIYHGIYLPPGWTPTRRYPVIVESPCNKYGEFTGKVDDASLGYHLGGCRDFVWIVVPYLQGQANLDYGWGDVAATIEYWRTNVPRALAASRGDPGAVVVAGFSRGAIGASFIGLADDAIADHWLAFVMHSHADVVSNLTPDPGAGSSTRMMRAAGRASFLSWGAAGDGGQGNSEKGVALLSGFGFPVDTLAVPGVGHTDAWAAADPASRAIVQAWLFATIAARPGTHTIRGRVVDGDGAGVAGATIDSATRSATTDAHGYYALRGLVPGVRSVTCTHPEWTCSEGQVVDVSDGDAGDVDFVATP
ncbi:MAG: carboxypeptidase-like regulatory domain-containing protein [Nannocystaceae bacterium]